MAPEVYQLDDMAHCTVRDMEVPAGLEDKARLGAASCPERAITVHE
jgi:ferredoxin